MSVQEPCTQHPACVCINSIKEIFLIPSFFVMQDLRVIVSFKRCLFSVFICPRRLNQVWPAETESEPNGQRNSKSLKTSPPAPKKRNVGLCVFVEEIGIGTMVVVVCNGMSQEEKHRCEEYNDPAALVSVSCYYCYTLWHTHVPLLDTGIERIRSLYHHISEVSKPPCFSYWDESKCLLCFCVCRTFVL